MLDASWTIQLGEYVDQQAVSSVAYDGSREVLWCGLKSGRVVGYRYAFDYLPAVSPASSAAEQGIYPQLQRVISYKSSHENVLQLLTLAADRLIVVAESEINVHATGGVRLFGVKVDQLVKSSNRRVDCSNAKITSSCLVLPNDQSIMRDEMSSLSSFLVLGLDQNMIVHWDMNTSNSKASNQVALIDTPAPATVIRSNGNVILVGGKDGKVRVYDNRFRSNKVIGTLDAHTGPVGDIAVHSGGILVLTCGFFDRLIPSTTNPQSTSNYMSDPLVKIFDLVSSKLVGSMTMTISTPRRLLMIPSAWNPGVDRVMMISASGMVQINDIGSAVRPDSSPGQLLTLPMSSKYDHISAVAASATGCLVACGSSLGNMLQLSVDISEHQQYPTIHPTPIQLTIPSINPPPATRHLRINDPAIASSYLTLQYDGLPLASSFAESSFLLTKKYHLFSDRRIATELLQKAKKQDFMSTLSNPGFPLNSLLSKTSTAYAKPDPRFITDNNNSRVKNNSQAAAVDIAGQNQANSPEIDLTESIPFAYRRHVSVRSSDWKGSQPKHQMNYDYLNTMWYSEYNATRSIGLENSCPNAYSNAMMQFLFRIPAIREHALRSQCKSFYYLNHLSLWCELGFVFHMLIAQSRNLVENTSQYTIDRFIIPSNFQRTFQQLSEVAALGLLDHTQSDAQVRSSNFVRFFLQHLHAEVENELKQVVTSQDLDKKINHVVDEVFGFRIATSITYLQSDIRDPPSISSSQSLDLTIQVPIDASLDHHHVFAMIIWKSLQRETKVRGWCSQSQSYERCLQTRSVLSIPELAGFLCSDPNAFAGDSWLNLCRSGSSCWLPSRMEISMLRSAGRGDDTVHRLMVSCFYLESDNDCSVSQGKWLICDGQDIIASEEAFSSSPQCLASGEGQSWGHHRLELLAVISNILSSGKTHNVLHLNQGFPTAAVDADKTWVLFNDFTITSSDIIDATCFPEYKRPVYVVYAKESFRLSESDVLDLSPYAMPATVLTSLPSLSSTPSLTIPQRLPAANEMVAFDGEFVSVELSNSKISADGQRIVNSDGRQVLARISIIDDAEAGKAQAQDYVRILVDDYVLPGEPVLDYVSRYSGITEEDLSPGSSRHPLISRRTAYLKLRFFIDRGCVFVGHGLQKDFEIANVVVRPSQIRDTVELWRLPGQRKISLRYLASLMLDQGIQVSHRACSRRLTS
jgi:WD40 repeat protein